MIRELVHRILNPPVDTDPSDESEKHEIADRAERAHKSSLVVLAELRAIQAAARRPPR